jgi:DNA polymerase-3 subunit epsilon
VRSSADAGGCFPTGKHYPGIAHLIRAVVRGIADEIGADTPMTELPFVAIDVEATGLDPVEDRVVEVACVVFRGGEVTPHGWLIDPGRPIPAEAQAVHHISDEDVRGQPSFSELVGSIVASLRGAVPLAYNAEFDRAFLMSEMSRAGSPDERLPPALRSGVKWLDPLVWARELQRDEKSRSLSAVAERLGIEIGTAHRATDDAEAAGRVLRSFLADPRTPSTYGAFVQEQRRLERLQRDERAYWRG